MYSVWQSFGTISRCVCFSRSKSRILNCLALLFPIIPILYLIFAEPVYLLTLTGNGYTNNSG